MHASTIEAGARRQKSRVRSVAAKSTQRVRTTKTAQSATVAALTSAATCDWGSSHALRRLGAAVLRPASETEAAIDVDAASSAYWQRAWSAEDRPHSFLDGSPGKDALTDQAWEDLIARLDRAAGMYGPRHAPIGSAFCNPPGLGSGRIVQLFWQRLERMRQCQQIGSLVWIGFKFDQMCSLIPVHDGDDRAQSRHKRWTWHPLFSRGVDPMVTTIVPGRRVSYLAHPASMIAILDKRIASRKTPPAERARLAGKRETLAANIAAGSVTPVAGPAPTHASYVTILWHWNTEIRTLQSAALARFLDAESADPKSVFRTYATIGASFR